MTPALLLTVLAASPTHGRIVNLYDAFGKQTQATKRDWGFSALVEYGGKTILFDAGMNADVFAQNVKALGIDLRKVDIAIASHSHDDHISGFDYLLKVNPRVKLYLPEDMRFSSPNKVAGPDPHATDGLPPEQRYFATDFQPRSSGRFWNANVEYVSKTKEIAPGLTIVVTASPYLGRYNKYPPLERSEPLPELSLVAGDTVVVGCSHSGVDRIVEAVRAQTHGPVTLVVGGFHLFPFPEAEVRRVAKRLQELGVKRIAPAHCTGHLAFKIFRQVWSDNYVFAGLGSEITF